jgi:hypothetical protein
MMCEEPAAWMWTMLIVTCGTKSTLSFPSLWEDENSAIVEAELKFGTVIKVKGKEPLFYKQEGGVT